MSLRRFFHRRQWDRERAREVEAYLDIEIDGNLSRGMTPEQARQAALRKLGNPTLIRERIYRTNTISFFETCWQNLRYAARLLRWNPGFASVAILSLALGIGANTAIFQLVDAVRLRALPVPNPGELASVQIDNRGGGCCIFMNRYSDFTNALWQELEAHQQSFSGVFAWAPDTLNLAQGGRVRQAQAIWVSGSYFPVLNLKPEIGRLLTLADDRRGCGSPGAVISNAFWEREYGGDPSVLGRKLMVQAHPFEIIGVAPPSFYGVEVGRSFDFALPVCAERIVRGEESNLDRRMAWWLVVMGRVKPGVTLARASAEMASLSPRIFSSTLPDEFKGDMAKEYLRNRLKAFPASTGISGLRSDYEDPLSLMLATAGLVLLIACANLANLALARATVRQREIAVRLAIGASRGRLIGQSLTESLLLASAGAVLGVLLSQSLTGVLVRSISTQGNPLFVNLSLDWHMFAFAAGVAALTCILFGLAPALRSTRDDPGAVMKASGRGLTSSRENFGLRRILVVTQIAL
ncbi:MAG: ABC transporter permease, partial [Bryobacteraceae bacterium]